MTGWLTSTWLAIASACLTLAAIHAHVWFRRRGVGANGAFALLAASVAGIAFAELNFFHADTVAAFSRALWWFQLPVWSGLVAAVLFVRLFLRAGRAWLGWTAIGLRTVALLANFGPAPNLNYREITSLERVTIFGDAISVVQGVPNPWMAVGQLALVALILFVADAARDLWRRGERRRAVTIGGSLVVFVAAGTITAIGSFWGLVKLPVFSTLFFLPIVLVMGFELSLELIRAVQLAAELTAKKAELQGSEERLALAADAASAGLWSVELATGRLWATPRALAMLGLAGGGPHRIEDMLAAIHPEDRDRVRGMLEGAPRTDRRASVEYRITDAHGETRWYASLGRVHGSGAAAASELTGVTLDITDRKRAEDETARQRVQVEQLSRVASLNELSGTLAHELNQPLAIIMSNAEAAQRLLQQASPDLGEVRAILDDIVSADERAGEVIKRLRGMLRPGAPQPQPLALNDLVGAVLQFMRPDLIRRGIAVELALADDLPRVCVDPVRIEQVLINVIGNACDAMAGNDPGDRSLKIVTGADAGTVEARIVDTGSGLPATPESAFAPFYTTKPEGLGLGLAISRSIVSAHGGRLWAEPNDAGGATFHIGLPAVAEVR